jgi:MFS family permease
VPAGLDEARAPADARAPLGTRGLLADRTFGPFFWGNLLSNLGQWFQNLTAAWVIFQLTGSSLWVGAVAISQFGPMLLLAPWTGALGDRVDRRRMLFGGQLVAFLSSGLLAIWVAAVGVEGLPGPWPVLGSALGMGIGYAVSTPAMQALIPDLVGREDLDEAVALNSVTFNLARAVGPALAGLALATLGAAFAFSVNAVSYLPLLTALLVIRPLAPKAARGGDRSLSAGLRYVVADRTAALLLIGVAALGFTSDPVNTLTPGISAALGRDETLVGVLVAAFGSGAALAATMSGSLRRRLGQPVLAVGGLAVLGSGIAAVGVAGTTPLPALVALAVAGWGFLLANTALTSLLQRRVPDQLRGRVMALWSVAFLGSRPLAAAFDGAVADAFGVRAGLLGAAVFALAAAALLLASWARLREASSSPPDSN